MLQKGFTQCHNNLRTKKISEKIFKLESENMFQLKIICKLCFCLK